MNLKAFLIVPFLGWIALELIGSASQYFWKSLEIKPMQPLLIRGLPAIEFQYIMFGDLKLRYL